MQIRKRLPGVLCAALMLCAVCATASAHEAPDLTRAGSITVTMQDDGTPVPGGTLTLYRAGDVQEDDGNYSFALTDAFAASGESLEDIQSAELAESLAGYAQSAGLTGTVNEIGGDGVVTFSDVLPGLYLLVQDEAAEGYNAAEPFLVSVPMTENGVYVYDVDASPKVALEQAPEEPPVAPVEPQPADPTLPQTGQLNWPIPVLAVLGLVLFSAGWLLRMGNKKSGYET